MGPPPVQSQHRRDAPQESYAQTECKVSLQVAVAVVSGAVEAGEGEGGSGGPQGVVASSWREDARGHSPCSQC